MKLKNEALKKLYDTLANGTLTFSIREESTVEKAFRECDDELSESVSFEHIKNLQNHIDVLKGSNEALLSANLNLVSENKKLEKDLDDAKNQLTYFRRSRDNWRERAKHEAEEKLEQTKRADILKKDRDRYFGLYTELRKDYDKLFKECKQISELRRENAAMHELIDIKEELTAKTLKKYDELTKNYQDLSIKLKRIQIDVGRESRLLWDMLQNVNDAKPFELVTCFPDVTCMDDILSWDLEDFLDAYKKWQGKKEHECIKYMRDYIERFCIGRLCHSCPLYTDGYICSSNKWFLGVPDEDVKKYYEVVRDYNKRMWHGDATAEKIKDLLNKVYGIDSAD